MEVKQPTSFQEQLEKLKSRGCIVADETHAIQMLKKVNYYRLTAYFLPFKTDDEKYENGTTFNTVIRLYDFDRKLRTLLMSIIEEIELMLRTQLSYYHAHKYGSLGYLDEESFKPRHNHEKFMKHVNDSIYNNRTQKFVKHHIENYDGKFPIWTIIELFTLGELSRFYSDMIVADQKHIAKLLYHTTYYNVSSWLHCLTDIRNYCAHYSRLYFNQFPAIPPTPKGFPYNLKKRVFDYILVLKFLYPEPEKFNNNLIIPLSALLEEYSDCVVLNHIGFPINWRQLLLSQTPKII